MAGEPFLTLVGNVGGDPELRFTGNGKAVATFSVASTPRMKGPDGQWVDGEPWWVRCSAWDRLGENVAETLHKGMRVIVYGQMVARSWEQNGERRTGVEMRVEAVGPDLRYAAAQVRKAERTQAAPPPANDPWATPSPQAQARESMQRTQQPAPDPWATPAPPSDEPPF